MAFTPYLAWTRGCTNPFHLQATSTTAQSQHWPGLHSCGFVHFGRIIRARPPCLPCLQSMGGLRYLCQPQRCEQMLGNPFHIHQPWVKLTSVCYGQPQPVCRISAPTMSTLAGKGPLALSILPQCPQVHFKKTRCSGFSCCLLQLHMQGLGQVLRVKGWQSKPQSSTPALSWSSVAHKGWEAKLPPTSQSHWSKKSLWANKVLECVSQGKTRPALNKASLSSQAWPSVLSADTFRVFLCVNCRYI